MKTLTKQLQSSHKPLVVPYIMAGDTGLDHLEEQLLFLEKNGAVAIEVGVPFSDPVADGPVIQAAGLRALSHQVTLEKILTVLAKSQVKVPLIIMSYFNPIFRYGLEKFVTMAKNTQIKGVIIPDLPFEHQTMFAPFLAESDVALVPLISLTSPTKRIEEVAKQAEGFIYAVTVNGITGERKSFHHDLKKHLAYIKEVSSVPVLAGFGISELQHIQFFSEVCDGVVIGSKIVQMFHQGKQAELENFLKAATSK
ncbi:tryptophan synthase subunit alpha [Listeria sp. PSOL-1]|uniref:tryptophan synthase subunit alpha n=1 Tax=Listeria sp. PSOL-1 TaxID=1844999 RepID=UPI0013D48006|nr:tryptophan synthase subunit alpha [Listeria sp. PSOL-1]